MYKNYKIYFEIFYNKNSYFEKHNPIKTLFIKVHGCFGIPDAIEKASKTIEIHYIQDKEVYNIYKVEEIK